MEDRDKVRLLIADVGGEDTRSFLFTDDQIEGFLELADSNIFIAASDACRAMAANEVLVARRIRFLELSTDGASTAKALIDLADRLATRADEEADFDIAEISSSPFADHDLLMNYAARNI